MKKIIFVTVLCALQIHFAGCAALFNSSRNKVTVNSDPAGAEIYVDGHLQGRAPMKLKLDRKEDHNLILKYAGKEESYMIESSLGAGWIILDVLGGLVPVVIDAATGSWYSLKPKTVAGKFN